MSQSIWHFPILIRLSIYLILKHFYHGIGQFDLIMPQTDPSGSILELQIDSSKNRLILSPLDFPFSTYIKTCFRPDSMSFLTLMKTCRTSGPGLALLSIFKILCGPKSKKTLI